ncbi:MAG: ribonuclease Z [Proteobacteria bacterium]|nr:ribonuclease Z [Desulfobacteraceae bacterium]MBU3981491.1 ribonuclease Z [Pseudomonadota bacterium]MBU4013478.1 ribonuclease Z [Pseudomonadota bacterium]MBU4067043.1 ribonuclease Z [Pseudomonadota bacterium]MBU4101037.1 ribonuclease Z [Pseudomonadota bacterium]
MAAKNPELSVTILGSGTCVPSLRRSSCSALIETGGKKLVFDLGPGTMRRLLEVDTKIFDISFIFFSHFHPDHTGELVTFLFATKYPDKEQRQEPITLVAGKGFSELYNKLKMVYGNWVELEPGLMNIIELDNKNYDIIKFDDFTIESIPVEHSDESLAYRVTSRNGISVVYSGDTDFSNNLVTLAKEADLLICESALPDELKVKGHLTPSLAGKIATMANVRKLMLTHFYPECDEVDIEKECRKTYSKKLILAEDLMTVKFD